MTALSVTLKIDLDETLMKEKGITADAIARGMCLYQDDVADGFQRQSRVKPVIKE